MNKPTIFISAVSHELHSARESIANILRRRGFEVIYQPEFGTESGELRPMLRKKLAGCVGLIQLIGDAYGAEPPVPDETFGRCSYTQFEFLTANATGKKTWLLIAGPGIHRDTSPRQLDLPPAGSAANPASWQAERRKLQQDYRQRLEVREHLYYTAETEPELELSIERLDDKLEALRREARQWRRIALCVAVALLVLGGTTLGVLTWMKSDIKHVEQGQKEIIESQKDLLSAGREYSERLLSLSTAPPVGLPADPHAAREKLITDLAILERVDREQITRCLAAFAQSVRGTPGNYSKRDQILVAIQEGENSMAYAIASNEARKLEQLKESMGLELRRNQRDMLALASKAAFLDGSNLITAGKSEKAKDQLNSARECAKQSLSLFDKQIEPDAWAEAAFVFSWMGMGGRMEGDPVWADDSEMLEVCKIWVRSAGILDPSLEVCEDIDSFFVVALGAWDKPFDPTERDKSCTTRYMKAVFSAQEGSARLLHVKHSRKSGISTAYTDPVGYCGFPVKLDTLAFLYAKAMEITEKRIDHNHPYVQLMLNNLAAIQSIKKNHAAAESLLMEAIKRGFKAHSAVVSWWVSSFLEYAKSIDPKIIPNPLDSIFAVLADPAIHSQWGLDRCVAIISTLYDPFRDDSEWLRILQKLEQCQRDFKDPRPRLATQRVIAHLLMGPEDDGQGERILREVIARIPEFSPAPIVEFETHLELALYLEYRSRFDEAFAQAQLLQKQDHDEWNTESEYIMQRIRRGMILARNIEQAETQLAAEGRPRTALLQLARIHTELGDVVAEYNTAEALAHYMHALDMVQEVACKSPLATEEEQEMVDVLNKFGNMMNNSRNQDTGQTIKYHVQSMKILEQQLASKLFTEQTVQNVALVHDKLAWLYRSANDQKSITELSLEVYKILKDHIEQGMEFDSATRQFFESLQAEDDEGKKHLPMRHVNGDLPEAEEPTTPE